ncbi:MAG: hypothetical protein J0L96_02100 [Anaerolineae bacterium]|nr:hypothetical protein [Anaerolineae bacterium]
MSDNNKKILYIFLLVAVSFVGYFFASFILLYEYMAQGIVSVVLLIFLYIPTEVLKKLRGDLDSFVMISTLDKINRVLYTFLGAMVLTLSINLIIKALVHLMKSF